MSGDELAPVSDGAGEDIVGRAAWEVQRVINHWSAVPDDVLAEREAELADLRACRDRIVALAPAPTQAPQADETLAGRLLSVPDEESMYGLLAALNYGSVPELPCSAPGGVSFLATLTEPDADHVNYIWSDESGQSRCVVGCENCGTEDSAREDWKPRYPVTVILSQAPDLDRAAEDEIEEADWLRAALATHVRTIRAEATNELARHRFLTEPVVRPRAEREDGEGDDRLICCPECGSVFEAEDKTIYEPTEPTGCDCGNCDPKTTVRADAEQAAARALMEAEREWRDGWAGWLEGWSGAVCPEPPTIEAVIGWLRSDQTPFGVYANTDAERAEGMIQ